jgi:hypothetical protein
MTRGNTNGSIVKTIKREVISMQVRINLEGFPNASIRPSDTGADDDGWIVEVPRGEGKTPNAIYVSNDCAVIVDSDGVTVSH